MRKIGELKGKPIIEGNPNEIKKNQIHYKESDGNITLSERKGDNTLSSVTSGSGSGESGGVKEYYYRVANEIPEEYRVIFVSLLNVVLVSSVLISDSIDNFTTCYKVTNCANRDGSGAPLSNLSNIIAFSYLDGNTHFISYNMDRPTILTGNLFEKLSQVAGGEAEAIRQMLEPYFQEITKEEYESMITYKPE